MKNLGQFLVGLWVFQAIRAIYISSTEPEMTMKWGFLFLIVGSILWYKGKQKEDKDDWEKWKKENVKDPE